MVDHHTWFIPYIFVDYTPANAFQPIASLSLKTKINMVVGLLGIYIFLTLRMNFLGSIEILKLVPPGNTFSRCLSSCYICTLSFGGLILLLQSVMYCLFLVATSFVSAPMVPGEIIALAGSITST